MTLSLPSTCSTVPVMKVSLALHVRCCHEEVYENQAVVDRIEGHNAVLIVEYQPLNVAFDKLLRDTKEGNYLQVQIVKVKSYRQV